ncbi:MAG: DNA topoisomerase VI subunit B [Methylotenera sp.]|nr:DNA topoisomerase VI subunit B [Oligoflexia bacterium]
MVKKADSKAAAKKAAPKASSTPSAKGGAASETKGAKASPKSAGSAAKKTADADTDAPVRASKASKSITTSSTAEYFSKNLQQVGFSSQVKAVLTTLKEAVDNALDACEEHGFLPEVEIWVEKIGAGSLKNSDQVRIRVLDNGPGIDPDDVPKVFGEYLASSKFGRGRCSRGQQGIGISAATTWAQLTNATGARVITKTPKMRKAMSCTVEVDIKHNKGVLKDREMIEWDRENGTSVEFVIDGRIQLNGEAGLINYLTGTTLVNPHLTLHSNLPDLGRQTVERVTQEIPAIPEAVEPHPHTMKLGEFIAHSHLFGRVKVGAWLKKGFSRVNEGTLKDLVKAGIKASLLEKSVDGMNEVEFKDLFTKIQNIQLMAPSTKSVLSIGEEALAKSIKRLGAVDFFAVVTRKPTICDFKPVEVEVAVARLEDRAMEADAPVQVLRFANRVPLQFDKAACAIVQALTSVNWRAYGISQPKEALPQGPYIIAVSVVSPFIKFKNASKETVDASDELVEEIRRALIQAGQRLSKHIRKEDKANDLEEKLRHIEQFCPILVDGLCRITEASEARKKRAEDGLVKLLGRDTRVAEQELAHAHVSLEKMTAAENADPSLAGTKKGSGKKNAEKKKSSKKEAVAAE